MRLTLTLAVTLLPLALSAQSSLPADMVGARIASLDSGVICAPEVVGQSPAPGTVAGFTNIIEVDPPFVTGGQLVPAVLGIGFGVRAMTRDVAGLSDVMMTVTHPPMGDDGLTVQQFFTSISGTEQSFTFYQFDQEYELLPGIWTMEAAIDGVVLYHATFEVVPPQALPQLATLCGFESLLS